MFLLDLLALTVTGLTSLRTLPHHVALRELMLTFFGDCIQLANNTSQSVLNTYTSQKPQDIVK